MTKEEIKLIFKAYSSKVISDVAFDKEATDSNVKVYRIIFEDRNRSHI